MKIPFPLKTLPLLACLLAATGENLSAALDATSLDRMRGCNADCKSLEPEAAALLAGWKCNVIRVIIDADSDAVPTAADPLAAYQGSLEKLRAFLPGARQRKINVIICLKDAYGRTYDGAFWNTDADGTKARANVVAFWKAFATTYKSEAAIIGYDLLERPDDGSAGAAVWLEQLLPAASAAVRTINKDVWLVVEPAGWGGPGGLANIKPTNDARTIYGIDGSYPSSYVRQGIGGAVPEPAITYPGRETNPNGDPAEFIYDHTALETYFAPAADFVAKTRKRVMIVNFDVSRAAPNADKWTADMISIYEAHKWDWAYGAMFGYSGGNPTFSAQEPDVLATKQGDHLQPAFTVLKSGWSKNGGL